MCNFAFKEIEAIQGKTKYFKIIRNEVCFFDEFEQEVKHQNQYKQELEKIYYYMEYLCKGGQLPKEKFHDITLKKLNFKGFEFKTKHLRLYGVYLENDKFIFLGGYKNQQDKDLNKFQHLSEQLNQYLKSIENGQTGIIKK